MGCVGCNLIKISDRSLRLVAIEQLMQSSEPRRAMYTHSKVSPSSLGVRVWLQTQSGK